VPGKGLEADSQKLVTSQKKTPTEASGSFIGLRRCWCFGVSSLAAFIHFTNNRSCKMTVLLVRYPKAVEFVF
jgi:hypothetical protein